MKIAFHERSIKNQRKVEENLRHFDFPLSSLSPRNEEETSVGEGKKLNRDEGEGMKNRDPFLGVAELKAKREEEEDEAAAEKISFCFAHAAENFSSFFKVFPSDGFDGCSIIDSSDL